MLVSKISGKIANKFAHFVNMTFKCVEYDKACTYSKLSKVRFRFLSLKEHFILRKKQRHLKSALNIIMHVLKLLFNKTI